MNRFAFILLLVSVLACEQGIIPSKKSDLLKEVLHQPLVKNQNLPILQNEFFDEFSKKEIEEYIDTGIKIWTREELFMRGISNFITINQVELNDETLVINFHYPAKGQMIHVSVHYRK